MSYDNNTEVEHAKLSVPIFNNLDDIARHQKQTRSVTKEHFGWAALNASKQKGAIHQGSSGHG
jgi:hypothetical protein